MAESDVETQTTLLSEEEPRVPRRMSFMGKGLLDGNFPEACKVPDPIINVIMYYKQAPTLDSFTRAFEAHILSLTRFACRAEGGNWVPLSRPLDYTYHFQEVRVRDERAIDSFAEDIAPRSLDGAHPLWQVYVIRAPAPSRSAVLLRAHHCLGDGLGCIFAFAPLLGVDGGVSALSTLPLPTQFLPPSVQKEKAEAKEAAASGGKVAPKPGCVRAAFQSVGGAFMSAFRFLQGAVVPLVATYDSDLALNEPEARRKGTLVYSGTRRFLRLPPTDLARIKRIGKRHNASVNDVLLAVLTGALRRYGAEVLNEELLKPTNDKDELARRSRLQFKAMMTVALPRPIDEDDRNSSLRNRFNFASLKLPIGVQEPKDRLASVKATMTPLKSYALMLGSWLAAQTVIKIMPQKLNRQTVLELFSKHSLVCANVPGPSVPMRFPAEGGEIVEEVHLIFPNIISQVSMLSYNGKVFVGITVDPELWKQAESLSRLWNQELDDLEKSVAGAE